MAKMRVVQVSRPKGPFEVVERPIPEPMAGSVRIKVDACGICHSDSVTKDGLFPGIQYPRVPGHEVAGVIDAVGPGVAGWELGQRVGVGWNGGYCGYCDHCRRGRPDLLWGCAVSSSYFAGSAQTQIPALPAASIVRPSGENFAAVTPRKWACRHPQERS